MKYKNNKTESTLKFKIWLQLLQKLLCKFFMFNLTLKHKNQSPSKPPCTILILQNLINMSFEYDNVFLGYSLSFFILGFGLLCLSNVMLCVFVLPVQVSYLILNILKVYVLSLFLFVIFFTNKSRTQINE